MELVKYIGTLIILIIVGIKYFYFMEKEEQRKNRFVLFTCVGFGLMALPSWVIKNENVLLVLSILAVIFVCIGFCLYFLDKRKKRNKEKH